MKKQFNSEQVLSAEELILLFDLLKQLKVLLDKVAINLTDDERRGIRSVSARREGYVLQILRLCQQYAHVLPRNFDENKFSELVKQVDTWKRVQIATREANEISTDLLLAMGAFTMRYVDTAYAALQTGRKNNANLDDAMIDIDNYNNRFGRSSNAANENTTTDNTSAEDMTANK